MDNKLLIRHFSVWYRCKFILVICIMTRPSRSPQYCNTRKKYNTTHLTSNNICVCYVCDIGHLGEKGSRKSNVYFYKQSLSRSKVTKSYFSVQPGRSDSEMTHKTGHIYLYYYVLNSSSELARK